MDIPEVSLGWGDVPGGKERREDTKVVSESPNAVLVCLGDRNVGVRATGGVGLDAERAFTFKRTVRGRSTVVLVDSGASLNLINFNCCKVHFEERVGGSFQGVGGLTCRVLGVAKFKFSFGTFLCDEMLFRVIDERDEIGMYLATEFLQHMNASVNLYMNELSFPQPGGYSIKVRFGDAVDDFKVSFGNVTACEGEVARIVNHMEEGWCDVINVKTGEVDESVDDRGPWTDERLVAELELESVTNPVMCGEVFSMLKSECEVFSKGSWDIGDARLRPYDIELIDPVPVNEKARWFPPSVFEALREEIEVLKSQNIIVEDDGPYCSPIVPVKKAQGLRMCLDFRKLNKKIKIPSYPLPHMKNILYRIKGLRWFSTVDLIKGYFQIPLTERCQEYTAFSFMGGKYKFSRLPQGLACSSGAFQQAMDRIIGGLEGELKELGSVALCFVDDIMMGSESFEGHLGAVKLVLGALHNNGLKIKLSKAEWFKREVKFLGHLIGGDKIKKSPEFFNKVKEFEKPQTVGAMRSFLGLINFHRNFIDQCARLTHPLTDLLSLGDKVKIEWSPELEQAYDEIRNRAVAEVELMAPDWSSEGGLLKLYVDASAYAMGAKLVQEEGDLEHIIAYSSKKLSPAQRAYSATDRELCAIRWAVEAFEDFLRLKRFEVLTDHKALVFLFNMKNRNSRLVRTLEYLADFQFLVRYIPGKDNISADLLSRLGVPPGVGEDEREDGLPEGFEAHEVSGGGDSLFKSVLFLLGQEAVEVTPEFLNNDLVFREELGRVLLDRGGSFGLSLSKEEKTRVCEIMKSKELPPVVFLIALSYKLRVEIFLYVGGSIPVVFSSRNRITGAIALQLLDGCHFNPLLFNGVAKFQGGVVISRVDYNVSFGEGEPTIEVANEWSSEECKPGLKSVIKVSVCDIGLNCLCDSGSEVCLLSAELYGVIKKKLLESGGGVNEFKLSVKLEGFGGVTEMKDGIGVTLGVHVGGLWLKNVKFLLLEEGKMFYSMILGANILRKERLELNYALSAVFKEGKWVCDFDDGLNVVRVCASGPQAPGRLSVPKFPVRVEVPQASVRNYGPHPSGRTFVPQSLERNQAVISPLMSVRISRFLDPLAIARVQDFDPRTASMKKWVTQGGEWPFRLRESSWMKNKLRIDDGVLVFQSRDNVLPFMPETFVVSLTLEAHRNSMHAGRGKLLAILQEQVMGERLRKVVADLTRSCPVCQLRKISGVRYQPPTLKVESNYPFQTLGMDTVALPKTREGYIGILTLIDYYSSFGWAVPIKRKDGKAVVGALRERVFPSILGRVGKIVSDSGFEFTGNVLATYLEENGILHTFVTTYHPSSAGKVERMNGTIVRMLNVGTVGENVGDWVERLIDVMVVYNETRHESVSMSPMEFLLSQPHKIIPRDFTSPGFRKVWREGHPKYSPYKLGDSILLRRNFIGNRTHFKLDPRYTGPYKVVRCNPDKVTYIVQDLESQDEKLVHHVQMRTWFDVPEYIKRNEGYRWYVRAFENEMSENVEHDGMEEVREEEQSGGLDDYIITVLQEGYWGRTRTMTELSSILDGTLGDVRQTSCVPKCRDVMCQTVEPFHQVDVGSGADVVDNFPSLSRPLVEDFPSPSLSCPVAVSSDPSHSVVVDLPSHSVVVDPPPRSVVVDSPSKSENVDSQPLSPSVGGSSLSLSGLASLLGFFEDLASPESAAVESVKVTKRGRPIPISDDMPSQNLRKKKK